MTNAKNTRDDEPVSHDALVRGSCPCPEWEERLVYIHPDDLTETERMELFKHLSQCGACATFRRRYRAVNEVIRDLPFQEELPTLELPLKVIHLWEFEDMQRRKLPLSCEEALLHRTLLSEISEQVENKIAEDQSGVLQEINQEEKNEGPVRKTRNWVMTCLLLVTACLLSFVCRVRRFRKCGLAGKLVADEKTPSAPEKEQGVVTALTR
jgi:hypothetical protein